MIILGLFVLVIASVGAVLIASAPREPETDEEILNNIKEKRK
jgi:hypothetical protein